MDRLRLRLTHGAETLHPVHAFEMRHEAFHGSELRHWNVSIDGTNAMIFRVRGDPDAYRSFLGDRAETLSFDIATTESGVFYCLVRERLTERDRAYVEAVERGTVMIVPPVRYGQDGTVDVSLVGSASDLAAVIEEVPDGVRAEVRSMGPYGSSGDPDRPSLTTRQHEAVRAAVDCGYYDSPRRATVGEIADRLGVSTSTAAEHLRKAEKSVMRRAVGGERSASESTP